MQAMLHVRSCIQIQRLLLLFVILTSFSDHIEIRHLHLLQHLCFSFSPLGSDFFPHNFHPNRINSLHLHIKTSRDRSMIGDRRLVSFVVE